MKTTYSLYKNNLTLAVSKHKLQIKLFIPKGLKGTNLIINDKNLVLSKAKQFKFH